MFNSFIPELHFTPPEDKLKPDWCKKAVDYYWYNTNIKNLLWDKDIEQIEEYFTGDIKMHRFMRMFKSFKKKYDEKIKTLGSNLISSNDNDDQFWDMLSQRYPLIQDKINSAIAITQKIPIEITVTANDALAVKKKKEDVQFLKNKPKLEAELSDIADEMGVEPPDLGSTKYSSTKFGSNPLGLDLSDPDDEKTFTELIYALNVETANEEILEILKDIKNIIQLRLLETKDQYKYAVSSNLGYESSITGLPDAQYAWPGYVYSGYSDLPDYSDRPERFYTPPLTIMEMFNFLGDEIDSKETLNELINGPDGYCVCNKLQKIPERNFGLSKVPLVFCMIKSVDSIGVVRNPKSKRGLASFTNDPSQATSKIWAQNTYCFWWLQGTKKFFKIERLGYAHRSQGQESFQNFPLNIYRSNAKSATELSIPQNIKAQIAEIKINFEVIMAKANGFYVDIRGMRNAKDGLKDLNMGMEDLLMLFMDKNIIIADTQGFEGKNDGQFKPVIPIEGGIKNLIGFLQVQQAADIKTDKIIGTNPSLTGTNTNPDALGVVENQRVEAGINALHYVREALEVQLQKLFNIWSNTVGYAIKKGGKTKQGLIDLIGMDDVELLAGLDETPLHNLTMKISLSPRDHEKLNYQQNLNFLKAQNAVTIADEYILSAITNPKKRFSELARIENRYKKQQDKIRQEQNQQLQALQNMKNEGLVGKENAATEGVIKNTYAKGDVEAKLAQLLSELGLRKDQFGFISKRALQQDRGQDQFRKALATVDQKQKAELLKPLTVTT